MHNRAAFPFPLALAAVLTLCAPLAQSQPSDRLNDTGTTTAAAPGDPSASGAAGQPGDWLPLPPPTSAPVAVLVELQGMPAAHSYAQALASARPAGTAGSADRTFLKSATADAVRAQIERNQREQQVFEKALAASQKEGAAPQLLYRVTKAMNALAYSMDASAVASLRAMPGVKSVRIIEPEYPTLSTSVPSIGAPSAWAGASPLGVTGQGVRIAIIDTGVDYQHATFGGTGLLADYQANDRTVIADGFFPNARVVGGIDLAGDSYDGGNTPSPDPDPMDCNGHGTHVASTAAGGGVDADGTPYTGVYDTNTPFATLRLAPGVAPQASVYAVRVFGCAGSTALAVPGIEWALDPDGDGDLSDHVDVINMSLGSSYGTLASTTAVAADYAASMGVIVVASAGNSGDTYTITGAPGSGSQVLTVAAVGDDGTGTAIKVNSPPAIAGTYTAGASSMADANGVLTAAAAGQTGDVVLALDPADGLGPLTTDACSAITNGADVIGKIALVDRGTCTFALKYQNVRDAGAIGMLVADNAPGDPGGMGGGPIAGAVNIPAARLTQADGGLIKARLAAMEVVNATFEPVSSMNVLAPFSSRGPRARLDGVKPDIAAPGVDITAAQSGVTSPTTFAAGSRNLTLSGTSMATPHVAGMMALLKERFPGRSVEALKAMAMNTALRDVYQFPGQVNRVGVDRVGAGTIDPVKALQSTVSAVNADDPGAVSLAFFGEVLGAATQTKRLRVTNDGGVAQTFLLDFDIANDAPGIAFSLPGGSSVTVPAGGSVIVEVQVHGTAAQMHHVRDASVAATQSAPYPFALGTLPRHYLTNESGYVQFSQGGQVVLRAPVYAALRPASAMTAASPIVTGGAASGSTTLPLNGQAVCTGTLVPGLDCTGPRPQTDMSLVSPFEWQASAPRNPAIPASANIQHAGVAYDGSRILFGVSTWGDWGSPMETVFNIYIDSDNNGSWDRVLFNTNPGSMARLTGQDVAGQDSFMTAILDLATNSLSAGSYINGADAASANTVVFGTNALVLAATPAQLGILPGSRFTYKVVTCSASSILCLYFSMSPYDEAAGPYTWNTGERGLDFGSSRPAPDLDGASLPVSWNTAHMTANGSLGAMLIHHHNAAGQRVQTVPLVAAIVNGTCGGDHGVAVLAAPTASLCSAGTADSVIGTPGAFIWNCSGGAGGSTAACSAPRQYSVTPAAGAGGSMAPGTVQAVTYNAVTSFTLTPDSGYSIGTVTGCGGTLAGSTYTTGAITANCTVSASFSAQPPGTHTISVAASPAVAGSVVCSPNPVPHGTNATCTATVNAGYRFTGWGGSCTGTGSTCTLTSVTAATNVTAQFAAASAQAIPTLSEWAMLLLSGLMGLATVRVLRRR